MSLEQNVATVRAVYEGFNTGNVPLLMSLVTEDFELVDMALGMSWHGLAGWGEWLQNWAVSLPDAKTYVDCLIAQDDMVATEHTGTGTHMGTLQTPAGPIPATGKSVKLQFSEVFIMRDGKIKTMRAYWDTATLMRQLGLM
jgi:steroid delta-isomerase-like uncharacterized protein